MVVLGTFHLAQSKERPHYWPVAGDMTAQVAFHNENYTHGDGKCVTVSQARYATNTDIHAVTQRVTQL